MGDVLRHGNLHCSCVDDPYTIAPVLCGEYKRLNIRSRFEKSTYLNGDSFLSRFGIDDKNMLHIRWLRPSKKLDIYIVIWYDKKQTYNDKNNKNYTGVKT